MLNRIIVPGGAGGLGGRGRECTFLKYVFKCATARMIGRGPQGKRGPDGTSGNSKFYKDTGTLTNGKHSGKSRCLSKRCVHSVKLKVISTIFIQWDFPTGDILETTQGVPLNDCVLSIKVTDS